MLEPLQVYDAGEHFMMSPLGEDEGGRGVYKQQRKVSSTETPTSVLCVHCRAGGC